MSYGLALISVTSFLLCTAHNYRVHLENYSVKLCINNYDGSNYLKLIHVFRLEFCKYTGHLTHQRFSKKSFFSLIGVWGKKKEWITKPYLELRHQHLMITIKVISVCSLWPTWFTPVQTHKNIHEHSISLSLYVMSHMRAHTHTRAFRQWLLSR